MEKIVIVGGGYGGIKALQTLAKSKKKISVTLIDQHTYHYLQTESYDLVASKKSIDQTFVYLPTLTKGINKDFQFIHDKAIEIQDSTLICEKERYPFDYCIIATGSVTKFLKGFEQKNRSSLGVKSLRGALQIKHFFEKELFARLEPQTAKRSYNILIIGGGLSGVEIACEMKHYFNEYSKNNALSCGTLQISLVSKNILKNQPKKVRKKSLLRLQKLGVTLIPNYVQEIGSSSALLDNGKSVEFDFAIFAGGIAPSPFIQNLTFPKDSRGFLEVDPYLRVNNNIFAIGDAAVLKDNQGKRVPPTAQSAEQSGQIAAENILNLIENRPLKKADIKLHGVAIALGGKSASVITPIGFTMNGFFGWIIKKSIENYYKLPLKIRAKKGFEILKTCKETI